MLKPVLNPNEVVANTHPDVQRSFFDPSIRLHYDRVVSVWHNFGMFGEISSIPSEMSPTDERRLSLPSNIRSALFTTIDELNARVAVNCHRFSRAVLDEGPIAFGEMSPISPDFEERPKATSLELGAIGVIGVTGYGITHSLVGLGRNESDTLQVMSSNGEIGFSDIDQTVNFYQQLYPNRVVDLYLASD